ncbi:MAG: acyltransferase family protein, partial [Sphingobium sp.]
MHTQVVTQGRQEPIGGTKRREHFWDAARALLMLLGIPYHAALAYKPGQEWIVASGEGSPVFVYLAEWIHLFRMPAFFIVAGYFAALLLARRDADIWLRGRLLRLGVPLVAAMLILVPPMNLIAELSNLAPDAAVKSWQHNSMTSGGYWVRHLWFLVVLLYCSVAAAAAVWRWPGLRKVAVPIRVDGWIARRFPVVLLLVAALIGLWEAGAVELFYKSGLATNLPQQIMRLDELIIYGPYFLLGCLVARAPRTLEQVTRPSVAVIGLATVATFASLYGLGSFSPPMGRFVATIAGLATAQLLIAAMRRVADRPIALVQRMVAASFVIYLFHMPIIVLLIWLGQYVAVPVVVKAVGVMLLGLTLSYGVWLVVERSQLLSFLFGGQYRRPTPS